MGGLLHNMVKAGLFLFLLANLVILRKISTDYCGGIFWKRPLPLPGVSARIVREIRFCNENNIPAI